MSDASAKPLTGRSSANWAGVLLLLTAAATAVMVFARVAADADEPTMAESLRAIPDSRALFSLSAVARLVSGVTLIAASWYLLRARSSPGSWTTAPAAYLLCLSGVCTAVSGAAAIILAAGASTGEPPAILESAYHARWVMGKVGFSIAGLALVAGFRPQWGITGSPRFLAVASAVLGAGMLFIWWDAATVVHRAVGILFLVWLLAVGTTLAKRTADTTE